mgnify:CR=1 FL=1
MTGCSVQGQSLCRRLCEFRTRFGAETGQVSALLCQEFWTSSADDVVIDQPERVCPQVPMPDLGQFNQLLSSGVFCHEQTAGKHQA